VGGLAARRWRAVVAVTAVAALVPAWDARLYAVGLYLRVSDFADAGPRAIRRFADEGWDLRFYRHGETAAVAVGESRKTGNRWLSINGKVDASTGDDMPTQVLSGQIPVALAGGGRVAVVGLASGVTAGAVLADPRVDALTVLEIEPAVVAASHWFDHVNGRPLDDPRTRLVLADARRWLGQPGAPLDAIVSEPSNPWITGVSSLFTLEYWEIGRRRLRPGGVFCQWVQLYGLGTEEFRAIVRTFREVFPDARLYETIPGADVLLVAGGREAPDLPPRLTAAQLAWLAGPGWLNTDDHPRVEWRAAAALHRATGATNAALIEAAAARPPR
jgi:spermidine synthase